MSREDARDLISGDYPNAKIIRDEITDKSRWSDSHSFVFELDGKYYEGGYYRGSTECQEERPFEYDEPEFVQVEPYEKTVIDYRPVAD
jgi:hypothetical protein